MEIKKKDILESISNKGTTKSKSYLIKESQLQTLITKIKNVKK